MAVNTIHDTMHLQVWRCRHQDQVNLEELLIIAKLYLHGDIEIRECRHCGCAYLDVSRRLAPTRKLGSKFTDEYPGCPYCLKCSGIAAEKIFGFKVRR